MKVTSSQIIKNVLGKRRQTVSAPQAAAQPSPFAAMPQPQQPMAFPQSGFSNPNAQGYLNQVFNLTPNSPFQMFQPPQTQSQYSLPPGLQGFANTGYGNIFQQLMAGFGQPQQQTLPAFQSTQSTPGPMESPQNTMMRYMGPLGNGGGYLTGKPFVPPTSGPKMRMIF